MTPYYADDWLTVYLGDCREVMVSMPAESVHCVVTSPPYWGLRDYGTATWTGGDAECDHATAKRKTRYDYALDSSPIQQASRTGTDAQVGAYLPECPACGATRVDSQLGLEPTPEAYVESMVAVFREVRRVLRKDGTVWLNLGDSYAAARGGTTMPAETIGGGTGGFMPDGSRVNRDRHDGYSPSRNAGAIGLKHKDLVGIPWRVAFALQADGWYLRSDIIWSKPNPMPESVTDRPTKAHEYVFLLSKSPRYYYDADAVREPQTTADQGFEGRTPPPNKGRVGDFLGERAASLTAGGWIPNAGYNPAGRNLRSVWQIATQPYPGAHFATFPRALVEPCIKAGTSEKGICPECGAPWVREVEREVHPNGNGRAHIAGGDQTIGQGWEGVPRATLSVSTTGWRPSCAHDAAPIPATILDPFAGSGTTGLVAQSLSRRAVLIDLSADYLVQLMDRNRDIPLGLGG